MILWECLRVLHLYLGQRFIKVFCRVLFRDFGGIAQNTGGGNLTCLRVATRGSNSLAHLTGKPKLKKQQVWQAV